MRKRAVLLDRILENKENIFTYLTENENNYAFSDAQMKQIDENFLLRSVLELPHISRNDVKEETDPFVRMLLEEPDTYEVWNTVEKSEHEIRKDIMLAQEELQRYIGVHTFFQHQQELEESEKLELLVANVKPDSCLTEKNKKKLSLYLKTANTKLDQSFYVQCVILPEADNYPEAVKVVGDILQQYEIPLLLLHKKFGSEVLEKEKSEGKRGYVLQ